MISKETWDKLSPKGKRRATIMYWVDNTITAIALIGALYSILFVGAIIAGVN